MVTWPSLARIGGGHRRCRAGRIDGGEQAVEQAVEASESYNGDEERAQVVGVGVLPAVRGEDGDGCGLSSGVVLHIAF